MSKVMLGDFSINKKMTNTKRMMLLTSGNCLGLSVVSLLTPQDGLFSAPRMVSRPAIGTYVVVVGQFEANAA